MQRVTIVGLGLIGGSMGLGLRKWSLENGKNGGSSLEITGYDASVDQQSMAKKMNAVDRTEWELGKAITGADLVILAVPVREIRTVMADIAPHLKTGAVITDTGSTKQEVMTWSGELLPRTSFFVGGHPMAGKEVSLSGADANLFQGSTWCVTPSLNATEESVKTVLGMIAALGAEPYFVDPVEHDAFVGGVSHLPAMLSSAMVSALGSDPSWREMKGLASSGFRDMSRLAGGSPDMLRDIALTNRVSLERWLTTMRGELLKIEGLLALDDEAAAPALRKYFDDAQTVRAEWSTQPARSAEMAVATSTAAQREGFSEQMGRMLFGSFGRRKPPVTPASKDSTANDASS